MQNILILGSTGSIGLNTCSVISQFSDNFKIVGLSTNERTDILSEQIKKFYPKYIYINSNEKKDEFLRENNFNNIKVFGSSEGIVKFVEEANFDILVNALTGYSGFLPTVAAIKKGKTVALANKESLVVGGEIINEMLKNSSSKIIPIDSEHSAIFQILNHFKNAEIEKIIITASGGPFFKRDLNTFNSITVDDALKHPTWSMGKKITIDSATMMNKGFEVIEAHYLFNIDYKKIETIIHPESIVHSFVEFVDGEIYAQLGRSDMRLPIQNALTYPNIKATPFERLNLAKVGSLNFYETDTNKFKMLKFAYECGMSHGILPCVLNAANEVCVESFLNREISFLDIINTVETILEKTENKKADIESVIEIDKTTREKTKLVIKNIKK